MDGTSSMHAKGSERRKDIATTEGKATCKTLMQVGGS
jgi:hypothetical protein